MQSFGEQQSFTSRPPGVWLWSGFVIVAVLLGMGGFFGWAGQDLLTQAATASDDAAVSGMVQQTGMVLGGIGGILALLGAQRLWGAIRRFSTVASGSVYVSRTTVIVSNQSGHERRIPRDRVKLIRVMKSLGASGRQRPVTHAHIRSAEGNADVFVDAARTGDFLDAVIGKREFLRREDWLSIRYEKT